MIQKITINDLIKLAKEIFKTNNYYINILCNKEIKKMYESNKINFL
jgi:predicted Zn-dependent peptidase